eukprot:COSAG01_NODE_14724_length_1418_cov_1.672479_1_plen_323_part_01
MPRASGPPPLSRPLIDAAVELRSSASPTTAAAQHQPAEEEEEEAVVVCCGEAGLLLMLVVLASVGLTVALSSAYPSDSDCRAPPPSCTFTDGYAVGLRRGLVGAAWATNRSACCDTCEDHGAPQQAEACAAAVFLNTSNASSVCTLSLFQPNCLLYGAEAADTAPVPLAGASLCRPSSAQERSASHSWLYQQVVGQQSAQHWLHSELSDLLGASAMLVRFGGLLFVSLMPKVLGCCCDYRGASLAQTLLRPRAAAKAVRWIAEDDPETGGCCGGCCGGGDAVAAPAAEREGNRDQQSGEAAEGAPEAREPWRGPAVPAEASFG